MTRKHYNVFHSIIKQKLTLAKNEDEKNGIKAVAMAMAQYMAHENPRFNMNKFFEGIEL